MRVEMSCSRARPVSVTIEDVAKRVDPLWVAVEQDDRLPVARIAGLVR